MLNKISLSLFAIFLSMVPFYAFANSITDMICLDRNTKFSVEHSFALNSANDQRNFVSWNAHNFIVEPGRLIRFDENILGPIYSFQTNEEVFLGVVSKANPSRDKILITSSSRGLAVYRWQESTAQLNFLHEIKLEGQRNNRKVFSPAIDIIRHPRSPELLILGLFSIHRFSLPELVAENFAGIEIESQTLINSNFDRALAFHYSPTSIDSSLQNRLYIVTQSERNDFRSAVQYYDLATGHLGRDFRNRPFLAPIREFPYNQRIRNTALGGNAELSSEIGFTISNTQNHYYFGANGKFQMEAPVLSVRRLKEDISVVFSYKQPPILNQNSLNKSCQLVFKNARDLIAADSTDQYWVLFKRSIQKLRIQK